MSVIRENLALVWPAMVLGALVGALSAAFEWSVGATYAAGGLAVFLGVFIALEIYQRREGSAHR